MAFTGGGKRMRYVPNDEERERFELYLERNGIEDDKEIQDAWQEYCDELEDGVCFIY